MIAAYLDHLRRVRGLEPKTCEGHLVAARRVLAWYDAHVPGQPIATMTREHVLAVVEHLLALSSNDYTRTSTTSYIGTFLRFCVGAISTARILLASFRVRLAIG